MKADYRDDPIEAPTAAGWEREATAADDRNEADRQAQVDNRLDPEEKAIVIGCLATFITQMRHDLNLNPQYRDSYRADMRKASSAIAKISGWLS